MREQSFTTLLRAKSLSTFAVVQYNIYMVKAEVLNVKTLNLKESHLQEIQCDSDQFYYQNNGMYIPQN